MQKSPTWFDRTKRFIASNGGMSNTMRIAWRKVRRCGLADALSAAKGHALPGRANAQRRYRRFLRLHEKLPTPKEQAELLNASGTLPRIALFAVENHPEESYLAADVILRLREILTQIYPAWEIWLNADFNLHKLSHLLGGRNAERVKFLELSEGMSHFDLLEQALAQTDCDYVARIDLRDRLADHALHTVGQRLRQEPELDLIYSDEDSLDNRGNRHAPSFKPQWSPDTLLAYNYIGRLAVYRRSLVQEARGWRKDAGVAADYDLALRVTEKTAKIERVAEVLYHRGYQPECDPEAEHRVRLEAMQRRKIAAQVDEEPPQTIRLAVAGEPLVSIIIPTRDKADLLRRCVASIRERSTWSRYELIIVDNGSSEAEALDLLRELEGGRDVTILRDDAPFNFARLNNLAVARAGGEFLVFLNNDTEVISPDWLEQMLGHAAEEHIGAVGVRLLYPDGTLQHVGVARVGPGPTHVFGGMEEETATHPRANLTGNWSAVTGACLMLAKHKFDEVGGFDEEFPVTYNDVDLCYALLAKGYFNLVVQTVRLTHFEFATRGNDRADEARRLALEAALERLDDKWPQYVDDPCYNPNLSDSFGDFMPRN